MKSGDIYKHHNKGTEYIFIGISTPVSETTILFSEQKKEYFSKVFHTEKEKEITMLELNGTGVFITDCEEPLVIYRTNSDFSEPPRIWGRPVDMFFGHIEKEPGHMVKRFTYLRSQI